MKNKKHQISMLKFRQRLRSRWTKLERSRIVDGAIGFVIGLVWLGFHFRRLGLTHTTWA